MVTLEGPVPANWHPGDLTCLVVGNACEQQLRAITGSAWGARATRMAQVKGASGGRRRMARWGLAKTLVALTLGLSCVAGCASRSETCSAPGDKETDIAGYHLGPGDLVRVTVFQQADLSGEFRLDGDGHLALPLAGEIEAGGLTTRGLEQAIAARLHDGSFLVDPKVGAQVLTYRPFYILGEVRKPGEYEYKNAMTVINAVALAGGQTYRAKTSAATIERGTCTMDARVDTPVLPGDIIRIPERFF
jgi:protein involved in polysaccharide export with SLBB domain